MNISAELVLGIMALLVVAISVFYDGFWKGMAENVRTVLKEDPAAKNVIEALFCYPGIHSLWLHRIAHSLHEDGFVVLARLVSQVSRFLTGIEIHPGAKIGRRFFIDHGAGVVIGETSEIGDDVLLYQGVVLGGTSLEKKKRHPTLESGVVIGAGAIVLGAVTIGQGARIGAGSVVVKNVPPGATVVGIPGRIVGPSELIPKLDLEWGKLPDPIADALRQIEERIKRLEEKDKKNPKNDKGTDNK